MIIISKTSQATNSYIKIKEHPGNDLYSTPARVSRTATLNGGVVIDHMGFVQGDRTFSVNCKLTEADEAALYDMFSNDILIGFACSDGYFTGSISNMVRRGGNVNFTFLVKDKE